MADLFAIIKATEHLEIAYGRDSVTQKEYTTACLKLISQFKSTEAALVKNGTIRSSEEFMQEYNMECPRAVDRLLRTGVPATTLHQMQSAEESSKNEAVLVAETVQHFITAMDALKLDQRAVDELQPLLSDLMDALTRVPGIPGGFEPVSMLKRWLIVLNGMRAVDEIDEEQARQLSFELDTAYAGFHRFLKQG